MSKVCEICGKKPSFGNNVSHANNHTKRRWNVNIQRVRIKTKGGTKKSNVCTSCISADKITKAV